MPRSATPICRLGALLGLGLGLMAAPAGATSYSLTAFAPPSGATSFAAGPSGDYGGNKLNNAGQIIGAGSGGGLAYPTGFLRNANGVYEQIGGSTYWTAVALNGLNASGQAVGYSAFGGGQVHAARWTSGGAVQDLGTYGGQLYSRANAINAAGTVVGSSYDAAFVNAHAVLWSAAGTVQSLGIAGEANSINALGQVAGKASDGRAFLWSSGSTQYLTAPTGYSAQVTGMNDLGQVTGFFRNPDTENVLAFIWSGGGTYTQLGIASTDPYYASAYSINNLGQALVAMDDINGNPGDYIWTQAGGAQPLVTPATAANGWTQVSYTSINDLGQILGFGTYNGVQQAFLLTPLDVPAPGGFALFATGLLGLGLTRRRRARRAG